MFELVGGTVGCCSSAMFAQTGNGISWMCLLHDPGVAAVEKCWNEENRIRQEMNHRYGEIATADRTDAAVC